MVVATISLFEHLLNKIGFKHAREAAVYYTLLVEMFPTKFDKIKEYQKPSFGITPNKLRAGRDELLEKGLIAQVICADDLDQGFDREAFLPANPPLVWDKWKSLLLDNKEKKSEPKILTSEDIAIGETGIIKLNEQFEKKFRKYGVGTGRGSITIRYSGQWLLFTIINNIHHNKKLDLMLHGLGSFDSPLVNDYHDLLQSGLKLRALFDHLDKTKKSRLDAAIELCKLYPRNIDIRFSSITNATSRRVVLNNMAIDSRKLLSADLEPMYIGTIYLQHNLIDYLSRNFESAWENGKNIQ
jgi:hypothetical protein